MTFRSRLDCNAPGMVDAREEQGPFAEILVNRLPRPFPVPIVVDDEDTARRQPRVQEL